MYVIASVPVAMFHAAALSGWRLDYPIWLFAAVLAALATPLILLLAEVPSAPAWNVGALWAAAALLSLRIVSGVRNADEVRLTTSAKKVLIAAPAASVAWAAAWTVYFQVSDRVANTFG